MHIAERIKEMENQLGTIETVFKREFVNSIDCVLDTLTEQEKYVLCECTMGGRTKASLAEELNVSRDRIYTVEKKALRKS